VSFEGDECLPSGFFTGGGEGEQNVSPVRGGIRNNWGGDPYFGPSVRGNVHHKGKKKVTLRSYIPLTSHKGDSRVGYV